MEQQLEMRRQAPTSNNARKAFDLSRRSHSLPAISRSAGSRLGRTVSERQAQWSDKLLSAIERESIDQVRAELEADKTEPDAVLTAPSLVEKHGFRTPLMAAVARGDLPIFTTLLRRFEARFSKNEARDDEMRNQLEMQDVGGNNLAMLASRCGNVAILKAVMAEIQHTGAAHVLEECDFGGRTLLMHAARSGSAPVFRVVLHALRSAVDKGGGAPGMGYHLTRRSGDGRTILMHAARSGNAMALSEVAEACKRTCNPQTVRHLLYLTDAEGMNFLMHSAAAFESKPAAVATDAENPATTPVDLRVSEAAAIEPLPETATLERLNSMGTSSLGLGDVEALPPDPAVPVFNVAYALLAQCLWKGQRREQLTATDLWGRTVLTHAIRSGHGQLFDAALRAVRDDVLDLEVEEMLDISEDKLKNLPLRSALVQGGKDVQNVFGTRSRQLKADIGLRAKLSSIEAKIQSFIPGKLIVIFQLLLPETKRQSRQLWLLIAMSAVAPILNWAGSLVTTGPKNSDDRRSVYRKSSISWILGAPALFFWGVGTSTIGDVLGWDDSLSAALLAVATIVIPAIDVFFNSQRIVLWYEKAERDWKRKESLPSALGDSGDEPPMRNEMAQILRHSDEVAPVSDALPRSSSRGQVGRVDRTGQPLSIQEETKNDSEES